MISAAVAVHLSPAQAGCVMALINAHHHGVMAKLRNSELSADNRAVLEDLKLQLESTRATIERALSAADLLMSNASG